MSISSKLTVKKCTIGSIEDGVIIGMLFAVRKEISVLREFSEQETRVAQASNILTQLSALLDQDISWYLSPTELAECNEGTVMCVVSLVFYNFPTMATLVEEEEDGTLTIRQVHDLLQAGDLGVEARAALEQ